MGLFLSFLVGLALVLGLIMLPEIKNWQAKRKMRELDHADDPLLADLDVDRPAIMYFTADWCGPCQLVQHPEMEKFEKMVGEAVQIRRVDVDEQPDDARRWDVRSVPRTYIIGRDKKIHTVNMKPTPAHILQEQVAAAWA